MWSIDAVIHGCGRDVSPEVNMDKRALITGITGQDGSYLAEFCLRRAAGYLG